MQERTVQSLTRPLMSREEAALRWRLALAKFIREHRVAVGMTQDELGDAVGLGSKQFVSGIETGRLSIPPERLEAMANALQIGTREFAKVYLRYGNPWVYRLLWDDDTELDAELGITPTRFGKRRSPRPLWQASPQTTVQGDTTRNITGRRP